MDDSHSQYKTTGDALLALHVALLNMGILPKDTSAGCIVDTTIAALRNSVEEQRSQVARLAALQDVHPSESDEREVDMGYEERGSWFDRHGGYVWAFGCFFLVGLVIGVCVHYQRLGEKEHEERCNAARVEALDCLASPKEDWHWQCVEVAQVNHRCTSWPSSWAGK